MVPKVSKVTSLAFVKYGPLLMALTCVVKIWLFYLHIPETAKYTNIVLNTIIVLGLYELGRFLSYCKIHRFLCNYCLYGYIGYTIYLIFDIPYHNWWTLTHLILYTLVFIIVCILFYNRCKIKREIMKTIKYLISSFLGMLYRDFILLTHSEEDCPYVIFGNITVYANPFNFDLKLGKYWFMK